MRRYYKMYFRNVYTIISLYLSLMKNKRYNRAMTEFFRNYFIVISKVKSNDKLFPQRRVYL